jgi:hypothetical protein
LRNLSRHEGIQDKLNLPVATRSYIAFYASTNFNQKPGDPVSLKFHLRSVSDAATLLGSLLFALTLSRFYAQAQTMPSAQLAVCAIQEKVAADAEHYRKLDDFARVGVKPPDNAQYDKMLFDILGPTGAFENWVATISISPSDLAGFASMQFVFDCPRKPDQQNFRFTSATNSRLNFAKCPGSGLQPVSNPVPSDLLKIPSHRSPAVASGHLYQFENTGLYRSGNCTSHDAYVQNYNGFAAALERVS